MQFATGPWLRARDVVAKDVTGDREIAVGGTPTMNTSKGLRFIALVSFLVTLLAAPGLGNRAVVAQDATPVSCQPAASSAATTAASPVSASAVTVPEGAVKM